GTRDDDFSKVFLVTVTYKNAEGEMITEKNITLPWKKQFEVQAPFTAIITQRLTLNPRAASNPLLEFPITYSQNMLCGISAAASGKTLNTDRLNNLAGGGGSLWKNIDSWLNANSTQTATLTVFP
ncbi:MAG: hypothetical protein LBR10_04200, partial [Prevotellaceae bacterium]|nr:hypothetical protein [Prevotellaceae bacterium]